ncbi:hypothetical protein C8Q76DRAFT_800782 [Earliella scabrosa]|nr:hypothetical protein C8Q76DRAFT_800782 [Earliella scabrosa]
MSAPRQTRNKTYSVPSTTGTGGTMSTPVQPEGLPTPASTPQAAVKKGKGVKRTNTGHAGHEDALTAVPTGAPAGATPAKTGRKGPKPRPVHKSNTAAGVAVAAGPPTLASEPVVQPTARQKRKSNKENVPTVARPETPASAAQAAPAAAPLPAQPTNSMPFVIPDDELDEAEESGVEENDMDGDAEDDEEACESADDLDMVEDETLLQSRLAAEQPSWNETSSSQGPATQKGNGKGKGRAPMPPVLDESDMELESEGSGSEYRPSHDDVEMEEMEEIEEDMPAGTAQAVFVANVTGTGRKKANKAPSRSLTARQQLEQPVWADASNPAITTSTASASNSSAAVQVQPAPAVPSAQVAHPTQAPPLASTATPAALMSDGEEEEDDEDNDAANTVPPPMGPPPVPAHVVPAQGLPPPGPAVPQVLPSASYAIIPPAQAGRAISLNAQHPHLRDTARTSFIELEADVCFKDAFPDGLGRSRVVANALIAAATLLGFVGLVDRFVTDAQFLRTFSALFVVEVVRETSYFTEFVGGVGIS